MDALDWDSMRFCKHACDYVICLSNFTFMFASGAVSGALATALTNPTKVFKVC